MRRFSFRWRGAAACAAVALVVGAGNAGCAFRKRDDTRALKPSDFVGSPVAAASATTEPSAATRPALAREPIAATQPDAAPPRAAMNAGGAYTVSAMIGQINGKPVYADAVLEPIKDYLAAEGRDKPPPIFRQAVRSRVRGRLDRVIEQSLLLAEAERDLTADERKRVQEIVQEQREELIRRWGSGSEFVADARVREKTGASLAQTLADQRQRMIVRRYVGQKFYAKADVTRKDVERYYAEHQAEFNPPPGRTLRVIRATDAASADRIEALLAEGKPFAEVAADPANRYRPDRGGLWGDAQGEQVFNQPELNAVMLGLGKGERSPRVQLGSEAWWIAVEDIRAGPGRSLAEAQREIRERLRVQRLDTLTAKYQDELLARVSDKPIEQMVDALVDVAASRYALAG